MFENVDMRQNLIDLEQRSKYDIDLYQHNVFVAYLVERIWVRNTVLENEYCSCQFH